MADYHSYRRSYQADSLRSQDLSNNPWDMFTQWLKQAEKVCPLEATSMVLATADANNQPSARVVLLKSYDEKGLVWYTDSRSQKGQQLRQNPQAAILFYWAALERQVRIVGKVEKLPNERAEAYFHSRPQKSQISAAASVQTQAVANRQVLLDQVKTIKSNITEENVPKPEAWSGYCLQAQSFEFWQGREDRLHDRFVYQHTDNGWHIDRLSP